jgi:glucokinase
VALYRFLHSYHQSEVPHWLSHEIAHSGAAAISRAALSGRDALCSEALDLFITLYGREAGNHALKLMASGGVYIGGGIAPRILPRLKQGGFLQALFDKGRMRPLLEAMPVWLILNDRAALLGAARYAAIQ